MYPLRVLTVFWSKLGCVASAYSFIAVSSVSFCTLRSLWNLLTYCLKFAGRNLKATIISLEIWTSSSVSAGILLLHPCVSSTVLRFFWDVCSLMKLNKTYHHQGIICLEENTNLNITGAFSMNGPLFFKKKEKNVGIHFFSQFSLLTRCSTTRRHRIHTLLPPLFVQS